MKHRRIILLILTAWLLTLLVVGGYHIARASTYADKVLSYSPIAYWQLNETSGTTAYDSTSHHYDGTYHGVTLDQMDEPGATMGRAGLWDGINDYVDISQQPIGNVTTWTISLWVYHAAGNSGVAYSETVSGNNNPFVSTAILYNDKIEAVDRDNSLVGWVKATTSTISKASWIHLAIVRDGTVGKIYVNGNEIIGERTTFTAPANIDANLTNIGRRVRESPANYFADHLAHIALYDYSLSDSDIQDLANPNIPPTPTPTATSTGTNTPTPRPPQLIATLQNGNEWEFDYTITAGQIGQFIPILLFIGLFIFVMILKLVKR